MFDRWQNIHPTENAAKKWGAKRPKLVEAKNLGHNLSRSEFSWSFHSMVGVEF